MFIIQYQNKKTFWPYSVIITEFFFFLDFQKLETTTNLHPMVILVGRCHESVVLKEREPKG